MSEKNVFGKRHFKLLIFLFRFIIISDFEINNRYSFFKQADKIYVVWFLKEQQVKCNIQCINYKNTV